MNPIPEKPNTVSPRGVQPTIDPATFIPENSSPQADLAALEAIGVLEAEDGTSADTPQPVQGAPSVVDVMTPFVPEQPTVVAKDVLAARSSEPAINTPQTNLNPFSKQKKSSKRSIIFLIAIIVLVGGIIVGYFAMQSTQPSKITAPTDTTLNGN